MVLSKLHVWHFSLWHHLFWPSWPVWPGSKRRVQIASHHVCFNVFHADVEMSTVMVHTAQPAFCVWTDGLVGSQLNDEHLNWNGCNSLVIGGCVSSAAAGFVLGSVMFSTGSFKVQMRSPDSIQTSAVCDRVFLPSTDNFNKLCCFSASQRLPFLLLSFFCLTTCLRLRSLRRWRQTPKPHAEIFLVDFSQML